ncbi:hybrid sensor histidine kinase/response regulator [Clostridium sp. C2-6-12]|uniref:response regulator n=1 Tax=Clostridium sp. C2-6-12 TaxID=2698832 RepID=UPI001FADAA77|nr:hybrid sensor histidine kinase/response regulator [Clostridium sp. C2-6-12]
MRESVLLANMIQEIRSSMNGILTAMEILKIDCVNEKERKSIEILNESSNALLNVINNLSDISKMESRLLQDNNELFHLKETINEIYNSLLISGNSKGLEVSYYFDPNIDFEIIGDKLRLKAILNNLISNAVNFTDEGFVSFRIKLISDENMRQKIEFRIKSSEIGIDEKIKEKILNDFDQYKLFNGEKDEDSRMELAIVKEFAASMNGDICFESSAGKGSVFIFTCEFEKSEKEIHNLKEINIIKEEEVINKVERDEVILCVEDNLINQEVMQGIIRNKGFRYIPAYNGNEALNILKNNKIDLILMDIQMPELNGFETTKIIRDEEFGPKHIPIIAMTAYAMREDKDKCIQAHMDDYIVKPFEIEKLYEIIEAHLGKKN